MQGRISNIVPIVVITVLSVISVEGVYQALDYFVLKPTTITQKNRAQNLPKNAISKDPQGKKADYRIILTRNLFGTSSDDSKPETALTPQTAAKNSEELGIVLMGTISGSDNHNRAIILTKQTRDQELFSIGEVIEGALIKDIQRGKLVLTINGKDEVLDMTEAANMRPAYKPPPKSPGGKAPRRIVPGGGTNPRNINTAPAPRRRVVRQPRATQNSARPTQQRRLPVQTQP